MIAAAEALALPSAQPTEAQRAAAVKLLTQIDTYVRAGNMKYAGCSMNTRTTDQVVLALVGRELVRGKWHMQWLAQASKVAEGFRADAVEGYQLVLAPSQQAFDDYERDLEALRSRVEAAMHSTPPAPAENDGAPR